MCQSDACKPNCDVHLCMHKNVHVHKCVCVCVSASVFCGGWGVLLAYTPNIQDTFSKLLSFLTSVRV